MLFRVFVDAQHSAKDYLLFPDIYPSPNSSTNIAFICTHLPLISLFTHTSIPSHCITLHSYTYIYFLSLFLIRTHTYTYIYKTKWNFLALLKSSFELRTKLFALKLSCPASYHLLTLFLYPKKKKKKPFYSLIFAQLNVANNPPFTVLPFFFPPFHFSPMNFFSLTFLLVNVQYCFF